MFKLLKLNTENAETSKENNCPPDFFTNHRGSYTEILVVLKNSKKFLGKHPWWCILS